VPGFDVEAFCEAWNIPIVRGASQVAMPAAMPTSGKTSPAPAIDDEGGDE
jgi:hypothetical protein